MFVLLGIGYFLDRYCLVSDLLDWSRFFKFFWYINWLFLILVFGLILIICFVILIVFLLCLIIMIVLFKFLSFFIDFKMFIFFDLCNLVVGLLSI